MPHPSEIDFDWPIALFPLPDCVLLPGATIPLHVFEPRYRAMTKDALDTGGLIAMTLFEGDSWQADYHGKPPVRPHVCVGSIVEHIRHDDGRYDLLLYGMCRARIIDEKLHEPYRVAMLKPTESQRPMEIDLIMQRQQLEELLGDSQLSELAQVDMLSECFKKDVPTVTMVDMVAMNMCEDLELRYAMLACADVMERFDCIEKLLKQTQRTLQMAAQYRAGEDPDGISLN